MLKIGNLELESNVLCAPLAGISDSSYRILCRKYGAKFTFIEMINARAISYKSKKTKKMLETDPKDSPIGIQILGAELPYLLKALDIIKPYDFDLLDFNAACPVRKVCRRQEGAALMKDPKKLQKILKGIVQHWGKPVTIKIRSGWDQDNRNAVLVGQLAQEAGIAALFIHGRDKHQLYKGGVDYSIIADVKKALSIPVIASGDIWNAVLAKKMFDETGCDGILVARGALGNPWIFKELEAYLKNRPLPPLPSTEEVIKAFHQHLELSIQEHGEDNGAALMRKYVGWYFKSRHCVRVLRQKANGLKTRNDFLALFDLALQIS
jgi:tRNA-dihydrouridine synthase B